MTFRSRVRRSTSTTEIFLSLIVPRDVVTEEVLPRVTLCDTDRLLKRSRKWLGLKSQQVEEMVITACTYTIRKRVSLHSYYQREGKHMPISPERR